MKTQSPIKPIRDPRYLNFIKKLGRKRSNILPEYDKCIQAFLLLNEKALWLSPWTISTPPLDCSRLIDDLDLLEYRYGRRQIVDTFSQVYSESAMFMLKTLLYLTNREIPLLEAIYSRWYQDNGDVSPEPHVKGMISKHSRRPTV